MSLSWESDARDDSVLGRNEAMGANACFEQWTVGASCWWLAPTSLPSFPSSSLQHGDQAGVTLKHQAKGFMVAIMKGLMMVGEWSDIGSVPL